MGAARSFEFPKVKFSFGREQMPANGLYTPPYFDRWTAFIQLSGEGRIIIGDSERPLLTGQTILLPPGLRYVYGATAAEPHFVGWCDSDPGFASLAWREARTVRTTQRIETIYQLGIDSSLLPPAIDAEICGQLGRALLIEIEHGAPDPSLKLPNRDVAGRLATLFAGDLRRAWTVTEMASAIGMSPRTLARRLQGDGKLSCHDLLWRERIKKAVALLGHSAMSLSEVSDACGFASVYHFSRRIKEVTGKPPGQLRTWLAACSLAERQAVLSFH